MEPIVLTNLSDNSKEPVYDLFKNEVLGYTEHQIKTAFKPKYQLNAEQLTLLQSFFDTQYVVPDTKSHPRESSHPVLASLNQFSDESAMRNVQRLHAAGYKTVSIGDSIVSKVYAHHNCLLLDNARDQFRATNSCFSQPVNSAHGRAARTLDFSRFCSNGAGNCHFTADVGFFMHSMYDITAHELATIFEAHNLTKAVSYMHMPSSFFSKPLAKLDERHFQTFLEEDELILFSMRDFSFAYQHNAKTWKSWSEITKVAFTNNCALTIEVAKRHGPLHIFNITVTTDSPPTPRHIPLDVMCEDHCLVPDLTVALRRQLCIHQDDLPHLLVPNHVVNHVMSYINRVADEAYKFTEVAALTSGLLRSVKIGGVVYSHKWEVNQHEYYRVLLSLFVLGAIMRRDRTTSISEVFKHMKSWRGSLFACFRQMFYTIVDTFAHPFMTLTPGEVDENTINSWYIWHYHIRYFKPYIVRKQVAVNVCYNKYADDSDDTSSADSVSLHSVYSCDGAYDAIERRFDLLRSQLHASEREPDVIYEATGAVYEEPEPIITCQAPQRPEATRPTHSVVVSIDKHKFVMAGDHYHLESTDNDSPPLQACIYFVCNSQACASNIDMHNACRRAPLSLTVSDHPCMTEGRHAVKRHTAVDCIAETLQGATIEDNADDSSSEPERSYTPPLYELYPNSIHAKWARVGVITPQQHLALSMTPEEFNSKGLYLDEPPYSEPMDEYDYRPVPERWDQRTEAHCASIDDMPSDAHSINTPTTTTPIQKPKRVNWPPDNMLVGPLPKGLCMMQAFAHAAQIKMDAHSYCSIARASLSNFALMAEGASYGPAAIREYFEQYNPDAMIAHLILPLLAHIFTTKLVIRAPNQPDVVVLPIKTPHTREAVIYRIDYPNGKSHYSAIKPGGAADKFPALFDRFLGGQGTFIELSAAPGEAVRYLAMAPRYNDLKITAAHYTSGIEMGPLPEKVELIKYQNVTQLVDTLNNRLFDCVFVDAATKFNSESVVDELIPKAVDLVSPEGTLVVKTFANPHSVWKQCRRFRDVETYDTEVGTERYYIMRGCCDGGGVDYLTAYDKFHQAITTHRLPIHAESLKKFHAEFFREIKTGYANAICNTKMRTFVIRACTGVAGSAKTTRLAELLKGENVCFIAPTNQLSIEHTTKFGLPSYTPHRFFTCGSKYTHVVVDEISMFDARYLAMLAATFPNLTIYVAGDANQIGPFSDGQPPLTVFDYGVRNNLIYSYAVPNDICDIMRDSMNIAIYSLSSVAEGLCTFAGKMEILRDFNVVCFNSETAEDLRTKGYKANTISTYQGSREPVVVFYVDAKAVQSKLINHASHVYTALTRGTNKIVVYGEKAYIEKYLRINGLVARTYEEICNISPVNDTVLEERSTEHALGVPIDVFEDRVADEGSHVDATIDSLERTIVPINPPDAPYNHDPNPPQPAQGVLTLRAFNIAPPPKEVQGHVFAPHTKFVKSQVSDDPVVTMETLIKRYTKRSPKLHARTCAYITDAMERGIAKAVTGSNHALYKLRNGLRTTPDELRDAYVAYIERLNKKFVGGASKTIMEELASPFDEYNEVLTFMNKRQAKYDPEPGFDAKVKAGQGIASMSKRVNLLFAAYASLLLDKLRSLAHANGNKMLFATHGSDDDISRMFALMEAGTIDTKYFCNDISEWDASFCKPMSDLTHRLIQYLGCPKPLADWFQQYRAEWFMINHNKLHAITLRGVSKQFSGSPFTISENTICNAALMFAAFDFTNLQYSAFKGDDSLVKCSTATMTTFGQNLFQQTKHKLKVHCTFNGEFAGFIVSRDGYFPDLLRKAAKFFGKVYRNQEHFEEAQSSAFACTTAVRSERHLVEGLAKCHKHYQEVLKNYELNENALRCIFHTLRAVHNYKFESLKIRTLRPLEI